MKSPPPVKKEDRVLDLRLGDEVLLEALVTVIRQTFEEHGFSELTWEHPPSEPSRESTPEVQSLVERIQKLYPPPEDVEPPSSFLSFLIICSPIYPSNVNGVVLSLRK